MRKEHIPASDVFEAMAKAPWAVKLMLCAGGYLAFDDDEYFARWLSEVRMAQNRPQTPRTAAKRD
jgi:hypothetical protein